MTVPPPGRDGSRPAAPASHPPVVVTGALGFIGSAVAVALARAGTPVLGLDRPPGDDPQRVDRWHRLRREATWRFHAVDLADGALEPLFAEAGTVLHLAAATGLRRSPADYRRDNEHATLAVARAAQACGARLVHASTSSVYGSVAIGDETAPTRPVSPYGRSKLRAEQTVAAHVEAGLDAVVLRLFSVYGPGQRRDMAYYRLIGAALTGGVFRVHGDGRQTRSNTFVDDVVDALLRADRAPRGAVLNICGGEAASLNDVVAAVAEVVGRRPRTEHVPGVPGDQAATRGDASLARDTLGWTPRTPLRDGLARQAAWQRALLAQSGVVRPRRPDDGGRARSAPSAQGR